MEYKDIVIQYKTFISRCAEKIPPFMRFLKEKGLLFAYFRNVKLTIDAIKEANYSLSAFTVEVKNDVLWELINHGLIWKDTPEGWDFWEEVDEDWRNVVIGIDMEERQKLTSIIYESAKKEKIPPYDRK